MHVAAKHIAIDLVNLLQHRRRTMQDRAQFETQPATDTIDDLPTGSEVGRDAIRLLEYKAPNFWRSLRRAQVIYLGTTCVKFLDREVDAIPFEQIFAKVL
jgi:hypothetical protein